MDVSLILGRIPIEQTLNIFRFNILSSKGSNRPWGQTVCFVALQFL